MDLLAEMTLLYAEDEELTQRMYEQYFNHHFRSVYLAKDGQEALDIYYNKKPDVVILDINMPLLNGISVTKKIRQQDRHTKIILLTARSDKEALFEAVELGLTCYLEKPVSRARLKEALQKITTSEQKEESMLLWEVQDKSYYWNRNRQELLCDSESIHLTRKEKQLLNLLVKNREHPVSYENIYQVIGSHDDTADFSVASIKTLIKGLRAKLPPNAIKNSYGMGYFIS